MDRAADDLQCAVDPRALPRRQARPLRSVAWCVPFQLHRGADGTPWHAYAGDSRVPRRHPPYQRDPRLPAHRALQQAPAHRAGTHQRRLLTPPQRPWPAPADVFRRQADRLRGPGRRRHLRRRSHRGFHVEGHPRLRHVHRVRSMPVAVPRVEHRQATQPQAHDHGPARGLVCQGALCDGGAEGQRRQQSAHGGCRRGRARQDA